MRTEGEGGAHGGQHRRHLDLGQPSPQNGEKQRPLSKPALTAARAEGLLSSLLWGSSRWPGTREGHRLCGAFWPLLQRVWGRVQDARFSQEQGAWGCLPKQGSSGRKRRPLSGGGVQDGDEAHAGLPCWCSPREPRPGSGRAPVRCPVQVGPHGPRAAWVCGFPWGSRPLVWRSVLLVARILVVRMRVSPCVSVTSSSHWRGPSRPLCPSFSSLHPGPCAATRRDLVTFLEDRKG